MHHRLMSFFFQLLLPLLVGKAPGHWFCIAISLVDVRVDVLDSLKPNDLHDRFSKVKTIRDNLFRLLEACDIKVTHSCDEYAIEFVPVPQQDNCQDCGIHVIKYMELWKGRSCSSQMDCHIVDNARNWILYTIFTDERNQRRDTVMKAINSRS